MTEGGKRGGGGRGGRRKGGRGGRGGRGGSRPAGERTGGGRPKSRSGSGGSRKGGGGGRGGRGGRGGGRPAGEDDKRRGRSRKGAGGGGRGGGGSRKGGGRGGDGRGGRRPDRSAPRKPDNPNPGLPELATGLTISGPVIEWGTRLAVQAPDGQIVLLPTIGVDLDALDRANTTIEVVRVNRAKDGRPKSYTGVPPDTKEAFEAAVVAARSGKGGGAKSTSSSGGGAGGASGSAGSGGGAGSGEAEGGDASASSGTEGGGGTESSRGKPDIVPNINHTLDALEQERDEPYPCTIVDQPDDQRVAVTPEGHRINIPSDLDVEGIDLTGDDVGMRIISARTSKRRGGGERVVYTGVPAAVTAEALAAWREARARRSAEARVRRAPLAYEVDAVPDLELDVIPPDPSEGADQPRRFRTVASDGRRVSVESTLGWEPTPGADGKITAPVRITRAEEGGLEYQGILEWEQLCYQEFERFSYALARWRSVIRAVNDRIPQGETGAGTYRHAVPEDVRTRFRQRFASAWTVLSEINHSLHATDAARRLSVEDGVARVNQLRDLVQAMESDLPVLEAALPDDIEAPVMFHDVPAERRTALEEAAQEVEQERERAVEGIQIRTEIERRIEEMQQQISKRLYPALQRESHQRIKVRREAEPSEEEKRLRARIDELQAQIDAEQERIDGFNEYLSQFPDDPSIDRIMTALFNLEEEQPDAAESAREGIRGENFRQLLDQLRALNPEGREHLENIEHLRSDASFRARDDFSELHPTFMIRGATATERDRDAGTFTEFTIERTYEVTGPDGDPEIRRSFVNLRPGDAIHDLRVDEEGIVLFDTDHTRGLRRRKQGELARAFESQEGGVSDADIAPALDQLSYQCTMEEFVRLIRDGIILIESMSAEHERLVAQFTGADLSMEDLVLYRRSDDRFSLGRGMLRRALERHGGTVVERIDDYVMQRFGEHLGLPDDERVLLTHTRFIDPDATEVVMRVQVQGSEFDERVPVVGNEDSDHFQDLRQRVQDTLEALDEAERSATAAADEAEAERLERERNFVEMRSGAIGEVRDADALAARLGRTGFDPVPTVFEVRHIPGGGEELALVINGELVWIDRPLWRELHIGDPQVLQVTESPPECGEDAYETLDRVSAEFGINPPIYPGQVLTYHGAGAAREIGRIPAADGTDAWALVDGVEVMVQRAHYPGETGVGTEPVISFWYRGAVDAQGNVADEVEVGEATLNTVLQNMTASAFAEFLRNGPPLSRFERRVVSIGTPEEEAARGETLLTPEQYYEQLTGGETVHGEHLLISLGLPTEMFRLDRESEDQTHVIRFQWSGPDVAAAEGEGLANGAVARITRFNDDQQIAIIEVEDATGAVVTRDLTVTYEQLIEMSRFMEPAPERFAARLQQETGIRDVAHAVSSRMLMDPRGRVMFVTEVTGTSITYYTRADMNQRDPDTGETRRHTLSTEQFFAQFGTEEGQMRLNPGRRAWIDDREQAAAAVSEFGISPERLKTPRQRFYEILNGSIDGSPVYLGIPNPEQSLRSGDFVRRRQVDGGTHEERVIFMVEDRGTHDVRLTYTVQGVDGAHHCSFNRFLHGLGSGEFIYRPLGFGPGGAGPGGAPPPPGPDAGGRRSPRGGARGRTGAGPRPDADGAPPPAGEAGAGPARPDAGAGTPMDYGDRYEAPPADEVEDAPEPVPEFTPIEGRDIAGFINVMPGEELEQKLEQFFADLRRRFNESAARTVKMFGGSAVERSLQTLRRRILTFVRRRNSHHRVYMSHRVNQGSEVVDARFNNILREEIALVAEIERELSRFEHHVGSTGAASAFRATYYQATEPNDAGQGAWMARMDRILEEYESVLEAIRALPTGQYQRRAPRGPAAPPPGPEGPPPGPGAGPRRPDADSAGPPPRPSASPAPEPGTDRGGARRGPARREAVRVEEYGLTWSQTGFTQEWADTLTGNAATYYDQLESIGVTFEHFAHGLEVPAQGLRAEAQLIDMTPPGLVALTIISTADRRSQTDYVTIEEFLGQTASLINPDQRAQGLQVRDERFGVAWRGLLTRDVRAETGAIGEMTGLQLADYNRGLVTLDGERIYVDSIPESSDVFVQIGRNQTRMSAEQLVDFIGQREFVSARIHEACQNFDLDLQGQFGLMEGIQNAFTLDGENLEITPTYSLSNVSTDSSGLPDISAAEPNVRVRTAGLDQNVSLTAVRIAIRQGRIVPRDEVTHHAPEDMAEFTDAWAGTLPEEARALLEDLRIGQPGAPDDEGRPRMRNQIRLRDLETQMFDPLYARRLRYEWHPEDQTITVTGGRDVERLPIVEFLRRVQEGRGIVPAWQMNNFENLLFAFRDLGLLQPNEVGRQESTGADGRSGSRSPVDEGPLRDGLIFTDGNIPIQIERRPENPYHVVIIDGNSGARNVYTVNGLIDLARRGRIARRAEA